MWAEIQSMQTTYRQIVQGERPWNALGDFLNYWYCYAVERRSELVQEAIEQPAGTDPEHYQWAAFCAAAVEFLCLQADITVPDWVHAPIYTLSDPWFTGLGARKPHVQARLKQEAPEPFARRNVYCSPRVFANKFEVAAQVASRQTA
ncbi:hypothetical protein [Ktedonobacter robiniae]|uniref:Uncharacterized protein n=1 Tax=Ktedonobacter robiniae TaxID=2778365 RepID=A0ABQ3UYQ3_9CHLR|nr:hypothetical protein [Ktedonobacter robiniae]GHO57415.1 hypothetical protein KSB_58900 [Ktedonobacter robiniae]